MEYGPQPPIITGIKGRCPRCGEGHLFRPRTFLKIRDKCEICGLNYGFADPADGPAFFSMMVMAFPITGFALWLDVKYEPPFWVHLVTSLPLLLLLCILPLRPLKGWLICSQFYHEAEAGGMTKRAARYRLQGSYRSQSITSLALRSGGNTG
jgi:uncharacterized protein (DUF983 family)